MRATAYDGALRPALPRSGCTPRSSRFAVRRHRINYEQNVPLACCQFSGRALHACYKNLGEAVMRHRVDPGGVSRKNGDAEA